MTALNKWITALAAILSRWGPCVAAGMLVGLFAGALLMLVYCAGAQAPLPPLVVVEAGLMLAVPGFLFVAWVMLALQGLPAGAVLPGLLLNAALTGIATVAVVSHTGLWGWAIWIGMLVGALVGRLLCLLRACPKEVRRGVQ